MGSCALSAPGYRGSLCDHFDGRKFHNVPAGDRPGVGGFLRWQLSRERRPWRKWVDAAPGPKPGRKGSAGPGLGQEPDDLLRELGSGVLLDEVAGVLDPHHLLPS